MTYCIAPLYCRPWTLNGISPRLIESHYENHYGGAIRRLNALTAEIDALDPSAVSPSVIQRLKRDELSLLNSTLLHELYFASLGGDGRSVPAPVADALERSFGSVARWRAEFTAMAQALSSESGWVVLSHLPRDGGLTHHIARDSTESVAGAIPILALDMYEHAYQLEFGANADAYIAAFMRNIDWPAVQARLQDAMNVPPPRRLEQKEFADVPALAPEELRELLDSGSPVQVIDARPRHYATRASDMMRAAVWRDPERVEEWIGELSKDTPVVVFCVYGFHIGCQTAATLRKAGFDARYLSGGHYAWKAIGGPTKLFE
ncbi:superoxide dismutase [Betaproteobacteria bacterium PRO7]|jgi:Fe-Mn family superoxide dismutase|nr:superoxide dismutase [Betaproteobacteria bacterium PRO7]